jgi:dTDP-4-dehydrorhamnose 3,5-epimerase
MSMFAFEETPFAGLTLIRPRLFTDDRGLFVKTFHADLFKGAGLDFSPVEEFYSISRMGVVRGMHFQLPPHDHAKLVYCSTGRVLDVVVDLRKNSQTYGRYYATELSSESRTQLFIPSGFAHGFLALDDNSTMTYLTGTVHNPTSDAGIRYDSCGFEWPVDDFPTLADFASPF